MGTTLTESKNNETNQEKIIYNTELLNYECVMEGNSSFRNILFIIASIFIFVISLLSIVVVYTTFKISYTERIRELGMLSSIGTNKKQRRNVLLKETTILGIIVFISSLLPIRKLNKITYI